MSADAARGKTSLDNRDYLSAVRHFSDALKSAQAPTWLIQRSTAYHRLGQHELALADSNKALQIAINRGKRELIADAHFRRGIAFHGLKQYGNSRMCFFWSHKYNEKVPGLTMWISKITKDYDANGGELANCNAVTVKEVPEIPEENEQKIHSPETQCLKKDAEISKNGLSKEDSVTQKVTSKIRYEWYQSQNSVTVEILAKSVPKENVSVDIQDRSLDVSFPIASQSTCDFSFEPLFSNIDVTKSSYRVTPHKIEVVLLKSNPGLKWPYLQSPGRISVGTPVVISQVDEVGLKDCKTKSHAPLYPTSSKTGPKNWDIIVGKDSEEEDTAGPDAFFKMLYKNADPDTKRAMVKSYQESNGTSLSTQWSDVGSRKFDIIPPEGVEAKKWGT